MKQKLGRRVLSFLLTLAMVVWLLPGMGMTAYADDDPPYAQYKNTTTVITFDGKSWYLIDYDASTVTLLAKECVVESYYDSRGVFFKYSQSKVKSVVDNWYTGNITADAKKAVSGGAMFLLTKEEAKAITNAEVRKDATAKNNGWWLCSQGLIDTCAAYVIGGSGDFDMDGFDVRYTFGVRPALKLDLSKVTFDSTSHTFSLIKYPLWVGGVQVTSANATDTSHSSWSYDRDSKTLTLNGYNNNGNVGDKKAGIYAEEDLDIVTVGTNDVSNNLNESKDRAIYVNGTLVFKGNGTMNAKGGKRSKVYPVSRTK